MRDYTKRPAASGRWQLWLDAGTWYAIAPDGSIDDAMTGGATPQESERIAHDGIRYLNESRGGTRNLGQTTTCWKCGKITLMWWEGGDRPVCEHCESFLDLPGRRQTEGEIFVASDGDVHDHE